jgi:hypothetical protein
MLQKHEVDGGSFIKVYQVVKLLQLQEDVKMLRQCLIIYFPFLFSQEDLLSRLKLRSGSSAIGKTLECLKFKRTV